MPIKRVCLFLLLCCLASPAPAVQQTQCAINIVPGKRVNHMTIGQALIEESTPKLTAVEERHLDPLVCDSKIKEIPIRKLDEYQGCITINGKQFALPFSFADLRKSKQCRAVYVPDRVYYLCDQERIAYYFNDRLQLEQIRVGAPALSNRIRFTVEGPRSAVQACQPPRGGMQPTPEYRKQVKSFSKLCAKHWRWLAPGYDHHYREVCACQAQPMSLTTQWGRWDGPIDGIANLTREDLMSALHREANGDHVSDTLGMYTRSFRQCSLLFPPSTRAAILSPGQIFEPVYHLALAQLDRYDVRINGIQYQPRAGGLNPYLVPGRNTLSIRRTKQTPKISQNPTSGPARITITPNHTQVGHALVTELKLDQASKQAARSTFSVPESFFAWPHWQSRCKPITDNHRAAYKWLKQVAKAYNERDVAAFMKWNEFRFEVMGQTAYRAAQRYKDVMARNLKNLIDECKVELPKFEQLAWQRVGGRLLSPRTKREGKSLTVNCGSYGQPLFVEYVCQDVKTASWQLVF